MLHAAAYWCVPISCSDMPDERAQLWSFDGDAGDDHGGGGDEEEEEEL